MSGYEILAHLAPPIGLVDWLERIFTAKAEAGQRVPAEYVEWLQSWQAIRSDGLTPIDGTAPAQWAEVAAVIQREKVIA